MPPYKVIRDENLSERYDPRYVIVDAESGQLLDDAQGYGYKSEQNAHKAWNHKKGKKKKEDPAKKRQERAIRAWLKEQQDFAELLEDAEFRIAKGSYGPDARFGAREVKALLKEEGLEPEFTAGELLRVWKKM